MDLTQQDLAEASEIAELIIKIDNIDAKYVDKVSDEIYQKQPFFLSVLLGYLHDMSPLEHEEFLKIHFLIWEFFRLNRKVQTKKVTKEMFEKIAQRHIQMLQYTSGESEQEVVESIYSSDLQYFKSKALLAAILNRFNTRPVLLKMDYEAKSIYLVGIKTFIECFDNL